MVSSLATNSATSTAASAAGAYQGASSTVASQSAASQQQLAGNFNTFLQLLTAQLQHQDPLSPMDTAQFTDQLVQFSSVEQQININSNLEKMLANQNSGDMASAVNYLGQVVQGVSTSLPLQNGNSDFAYTTPANASKVTITLTDSAGNVVKTIAGDSTAGTHTASWNGTDSYGTQLSDGTYGITINSTGADGTQTPVDAAVSGIVTSVGMDSSNNVQLYMGGVNLPLSKVIEVQATVNGSSSTTTTPSTAGTGSSAASAASNAAAQATTNAVNSALGTGTTTN